MGISAYKLAKEIKVPTSRVQDILHGRRQITPDTSIRLGRYFGVSDGYFLNIQVEISLRREEKNQNIFNSIVPLSQAQLFVKVARTKKTVANATAFLVLLN